MACVHTRRRLWPGLHIVLSDPSCEPSVLVFGGVQHEEFGSFVGVRAPVERRGDPKIEPRRGVGEHAHAQKRHLEVNVPNVEHLRFGVGIGGLGDMI